ncbi:MAG TPA: DUF2066 domain-containing protein [Steroidobacter sp.]|jgi:hypothetical protein|nr:DUF2066 domain-containing protein [Steroidobacter sp.]
MTHFRPQDVSRSALTRWCLAPMCALLALGVQAAALPDLYETEQPVVASREAAFQEALKTVLVRVSGRREAPARLGGELSNPRKYVQRFGFTSSNVLQVGFDSVSIDKLLSDAGLPIWGRERPATLVALAVEEADGTAHWVGAQSAVAERAAIDRAAYERGLPLVWLADSQQAQLESSPEALLEAARRQGANATLLGRQRGDSVRWTLISGDGASEVVGGLADGVHLAADLFARVFAAAGSTLTTVFVDVAGVSDLDAYASTLNYLESITLVRGLAVEQVAGDVLRFRLAVRGGADTLRRSIALDNRLLPLAQAQSSAAGERLSFRFNR